MQERNADVKNHCTLAYLEHIRDLCKRVNYLNEEIERTKATVELTGIQYREKISTQSTGDKLDNAVIKLMDLIAEFMQELNAMVDTKRLAHQTLSKLSRADYAQVLNLYYLHGFPLERIAYEMNYTYRHTKRIKKRAIAELYEHLPYEWKERPIPKAL